MSTPIEPTTCSDVEQECFLQPPSIAGERRVGVVPLQRLLRLEYMPTGREIWILCISILPGIGLARLARTLIWSADQLRGGVSPVTMVCSQYNGAGGVFQGMHM
jgi:hypothetical protein